MANTPAPLPDEVEKAFRFVEWEAKPADAKCLGTIRAHIAAQRKRIEELTEAANMSLTAIRCIGQAGSRDQIFSIMDAIGSVKSFLTKALASGEAEVCPTCEGHGSTLEWVENIPACEASCQDCNGTGKKP